MALAQFRNEVKGIEITKNLGAPKTATLQAWFREIRKVIPEVPDPRKTDWLIYHQDADLRWIRFEMQNSVGERCYIVVDRTKPFMAA